MKKIAAILVTAGLIVSSVSSAQAAHGYRYGRSVHYWSPVSAKARIDNGISRSQTSIQRVASGTTASDARTSAPNDDPPKGKLPDLDEPLNSDGRTPERPTGR